MFQGNANRGISFPRGAHIIWVRRIGIPTATDDFRSLLVARGVLLPSSRPRRGWSSPVERGMGERGHNLAYKVQVGRFKINLQCSAETIIILRSSKFYFVSREHRAIRPGSLSNAGEETSATSSLFCFIIERMLGHCLEMHLAGFRGHLYQTRTFLLFGCDYRATF